VRLHEGTLYHSKTGRGSTRSCSRDLGTWGPDQSLSKWGNMCPLYLSLDTRRAAVSHRILVVSSIDLHVIKGVVCYTPNHLDAFDRSDQTTSNCCCFLKLFKLPLRSSTTDFNNFPITEFTVQCVDSKTYLARNPDRHPTLPPRPPARMPNIAMLLPKLRGRGSRHRLLLC
jgi:hypothetical protein